MMGVGGDIGIFMLMLFLVTAPGGHLQWFIGIHLKSFNSRTILIKSDHNTLMFS